MNSVETAPPTFWVGESGVRSSGNSLLERLELAQPHVEVGVGQRRVVEHVVAPAGVLDLLGELPVTLARLGRGGSTVASVASSSGCSDVLMGTVCRSRRQRRGAGATRRPVWTG